MDEYGHLEDAVTNRGTWLAATTGRAVHVASAHVPTSIRLRSSSLWIDVAGDRLIQLGGLQDHMTPGVGEL